LVEHIHVVHLAIGDADKRRDIAAQIEQCVHFYSPFAAAETRPREQA
jgi:hypothetical protein